MSDSKIVIVRGAPVEEWHWGARLAATAWEGHLLGVHIPDKKSNARTVVNGPHRWLLWMEGEAIVLEWQGRRLCNDRDCDNEIRRQHDGSFKCARCPKRWLERTPENRRRGCCLPDWFEIQEDTQ